MTIAEARTRLGLTRAELARLLKVTTRTIIRWEGNVTKPHEIYLETLARLVRYKERDGTTGQALS
jgi:DNA-binding transcriptional regulator YiaG